MRLGKIRIACALTLRTSITRSALVLLHTFTSAERVLNVERVLLLKVRNRHTVVSVPSLPVESQDAD